MVVNLTTTRSVSSLLQVLLFTWFARTCKCLFVKIVNKAKQSKAKWFWRGRAGLSFCAHTVERH